MKTLKCTGKEKGNCVFFFQIGKTDNFSPFCFTYQALVFPSGKSSIVASNVFSTTNQPEMLHANLCKLDNIWRGFLVTDSWKYWQVHRTKICSFSLPVPPLSISLPVPSQNALWGSVESTICQRLLAWVAKIGYHTWSTNLLHESGDLAYHRTLWKKSPSF